MNVTRAKSAGFCFGVRRAVDMVEEQLRTVKGPIYTYGPIIHNEEVVADLEARGVRVLPETADVSDYAPGTVILRSHGVSKAVLEKLENAGFTIADATCPFVKKIHDHVRQYSKQGYDIWIAGNESHPEVQGIIGWIEGKNYAVISDAADLPPLEGRRICLVSQTTFNYKKFQELVEIIEKKGYDIIVLNTICNATEERQKEAARIAGEVDAMLVIGGKSSSNTQKLFEICKKECEDTYYIQTKDDLDLSVLQD